MWQAKDWTDQPLHVAAGFVPTWLLSLLHSSAWTGVVAGAVVLGFAAWREHRQHAGRILNLDFVFWFIGVVAAVVCVI